MIEFVALVALGVMAVGLGVLAAAYLLTAGGWLVVREIRRAGLLRPRTRNGAHPSPDG